MIRVNKDYIIDVDPLNYTLKLDAHKTTFNQKTGEESDVLYTIGHYTTIKGAIDGCLRDMQARKLMAGEYDLESAINVINDCADAMKRIFEKVREEI